MLTIEYRHYRLTDNDQPSQTGGFTFALHRNSTTAFVGIAKCSKHDKYCKQTGRDIAYKRLTSLEEHLTITSFDIREFIYSQHIVLTGFTTTATTRFINSIKLDDVTNELIFQCALSSIYP